jgi:uncharacterized protein YqhQ
MAVYGGVLLRRAGRWAVAVRGSDGTIEVDEGDVPTWSTRTARVPVVRGVVALVESFTIGARALAWSLARRVVPPDRKQPAPISLGRTAALAVVVTVAAFVLLPAAVAAVLVASFGGDHGPFAVTSIEAVLRVAILLGYLGAIRRIAEVRELFAYHGAEHMVVAAHESGETVTVDAARRFSTRHARCGTTFLLVVVMVATLMHALVGDGPIAHQLAARTLMVPVIAGVAYEVLRLAARGWAPFRWIAAPGIFLQRLTTAMPDDAQLEVGVTALNALLAPRREPAAIALADRSVPVALHL